MLSPSRWHGNTWEEAIAIASYYKDLKTNQNVLSDYTRLFQLLLSNFILIRIGEKLRPLKFG